VDGFIQTDIYSKPTDNHIYLLRNSTHPAHVTRAIPYGVATRVRRNCSTDEAFSKRSSEYKGYLYNRGYNRNLVSQQFEKARSIPRQTLLQPQPKESEQIFPLVLDFNPRLPSIGRIIRKYKHLIYNSPSLKKIFTVGSIIPTFHRTKNIKEILSSKPREQHRMPDNQQGCFKCTAKCDLCCSYLRESNCFTSTSTSRTYPITQILNCKSKNVIYLVTCKKSNVQYVGSTSNKFKICFHNHKSSMITKRRTCEVAIHFNKEPHALADFEF